MAEGATRQQESFQATSDQRAGWKKWLHDVSVFTEIRQVSGREFVGAEKASKKSLSGGMPITTTRASQAIRRSKLMRKCPVVHGFREQSFFRRRTIGSHL
jgi:hypothetical protein